MIPELGHLALILCLLLALVQGTFPLLGAARGNTRWIALARPAAQGQCLFLVIAFAALVHAFIANDFSVAYVANNSNSALPLGFRISAVWGAHEGSMLLWCLVLSLWTLGVATFSGAMPERFVARVLGVMGLVSVGFLLFVLFTSNPFERLSPVPANGADLNPLLQDIGLIIHPPMLYMGYVGFSVAFSFAVAALLERRLDAAWARWSRPWTTLAWVFLTIGIALGSWWAYYELGWGGWWFWDPVENASFMPWLVGTALIHSLAATEKRGVFKHWTVLLAISAFSLSLLGTFLVRSGVLTSVHAFATDPTRGVFILAFLGLVIGGSLTLYALRAGESLKGGWFTGASRETFILVNNILLVVAMASVLLGTLYPLALDALGMGKVSVGPPYFNQVFVPIMCLVALAQSLGPLARWREDRLGRLLGKLRLAMVGALTVSVLVMLVLRDEHTLGAGLAVLLAAWILFGSLQWLLERRRMAGGAGFARRLSAAQWGMFVAHLGLGVSIIGVSLVSLYNEELHVSMKVGDEQTMAGYAWRLVDLRPIEGPNYNGHEARFEVRREGRLVTELTPEKRLYLVRGMPMSEAGIDAGFTRDLYVSVGEPLGGGAWSFRLNYKPFVRWIWLGAIFMGVGGLLAIVDRRYRGLLARARRPQQAALGSTGAEVA